MLDQILQSCTITGNVVKLPDGQLDRKDYVEVKKALEGIGGRWQGGKVSGFVFSTDPTPRLTEIQGGKKVNLKKDFQFFATPPQLAERLVVMAEMDELDHNEVILEPSAGSGAILNAIYEKYGRKFQLSACELMPENQQKLKELFWDNPNYELICPDFFDINKHVLTEGYQRILANPPFTKNQDIDHVLHMWKQLAPGGILVTIMSQHWYHSTNKKEWNFNYFVQENHGEIILLDAGEFKDSGTMVPALIVKLRKEATNV